MKLVIAEKPSVARTIAGVLGALEKKEGYIQGNAYIVTWCIGHLVTLATPEMYDANYEKWQYSDLPILPSSWKLQVKEKTKKQYKVIEKLMKDSRVDSIVVATDAGREGELIFRWVYDNIGSDKPYQRLWISSMEESAIEAGFDNLHNGMNYENLYQAAMARSQADWIVGLNATRLFTTVYKTKLSVGRVQTPTLSMIVERDYKINNFIKEKFYYVHLNLGEFSLISDKIYDLNEANKLMNVCAGKVALISDVVSEVKKNKAPKLYDLTTLQREANRYFGYTAKQTLDYAQSLYEKKMITYPRTDSRFITQDMDQAVADLIHAFGEVEGVNRLRLISDEKVTDHHAILPTMSAVKMNVSQIPMQELNIFNLIRMKLNAAVSLDYVYDEVSLTATVEGTIFKANEKTCIEQGYKRIEHEFKKSIKETGIETECDVPLKLCKIQKNDQFVIKDSNVTDHLTTPPKHYTEDTLLAAMESAGVEELDESLDTEKKGLGTPATRAGIIEKLIQTDYLARKKKSLVATNKGIELIKLVPERIKSPTVTAEWENRLTEISSGHFNASQFIDEIKSEVSELVKAYADFSDTRTFESTKEVIGLCPRCQTEVYESMNNFYCSSDSCNFNMWKEDKFFTSKNKKLTKSMATKLLDKGKIQVRNLYSEKKNKTYDATVILNDTGTWVNYKLEFI